MYTLHAVRYSRNEAQREKKFDRRIIVFGEDILYGYKELFIYYLRKRIGKVYTMRGTDYYIVQCITPM